MKRYGIVIKIKPDKLEEYKKIHSEIWPEVSEIISRHNIRNFSIYNKDDFLFGYFEYIGDDVKKDFEKMSSIPIYKKWLSITDNMQVPLETRHQGEWWAFMEEIFHLD